MQREVIVLIAEDDDGHATLIEKNLRRAGVSNEFIRFRDGQETLDFFFSDGAKMRYDENRGYLLLLDIRMPKIDGAEVLRRVKESGRCKKMPVIMITTTDDPREVERCHVLGCSSYITKPIDYEKFVDAIRKLGLFLLLVEVPS